MDYIQKLTNAAYPQEYPKAPGSDELIQIDLVPLSLAIEMIKDIQSRSITWSVEDFESRAEALEGKNWRNVFDEDTFEDALSDMIINHDASHGITWETIDECLFFNCKK